MKNYPKRPNYREEVYADVEDDQVYIFGTESGHAYSSPPSMTEAVQEAVQMNTANGFRA